MVRAQEGRPVQRCHGVSFPRQFVFHWWRIITVTMKERTMQMPRQPYTAEFKELVVTRVKDGMTAGAAAKELGLIEQTLRNWVKEAAAGRLSGAGATVVRPE